MREQKARFRKCILNQLLEILVFSFAIAVIFTIVLYKVNIDMADNISFLFLQLLGAVLYLIPDMVWVKRYNEILNEGKQFQAEVKEISCKGSHHSFLEHIKITVEFEDAGINKCITQKIKVNLGNKHVDRTILQDYHYGERNQKIIVYWMDYDRYIIVGGSVGLFDIYHC